MSKLPAEVKTREIAERITAHLRRFKLEGLAESDPYKPGLHLYHASATAAGSGVSVRYVNYQGSTFLTKREAAHYLARLDGGYVGRHQELFRRDPPPEPEAPEVRFLCLVRERYGFLLYGVHRRTKTRVYGEKVAGKGYGQTYFDRHQVIRWQAGPEHLEAAEAAMAQRDLAVQVAHERFNERIKAIAQEAP